MIAFANKIGKSTSKPTSSPYVPTIPSPQTNVVFKQTSPANYVALMQFKEEEDPPFKQLYDAGNIYSEGPLATPKQTEDPFSLGKDPIKTFYIGSVTVVGLFILYKILMKTK